MSENLRVGVRPRLCDTAHIQSCVLINEPSHFFDAAFRGQLMLARCSLFTCRARGSESHAMGAVFDSGSLGQQFTANRQNNPLTRHRRPAPCVSGLRRHWRRNQPCWRSHPPSRRQPAAMAPHDTALLRDLALSEKLPMRPRVPARSSSIAVVTMSIGTPVSEDRIERRKYRPLVPRV